MILKTLYIKAFGKLKDFEYNFEKGFNCIFEDNSFGKSTVAQFLKAVFFGLNYTRKEKTNDVDMYRPWDFSTGTKYGGFVVFEQGGKQFKLERYFGDTLKQEQATLTEISTGKVLDATNVGQRVFGLTMESFERSVFVPQEAVTIQNNADLEQKLSGMMEANENGNSADKALDKLREYSKIFKHERGNGGKIFQLTNQLNDIEYEISTCKKNLERAEQLKLEIFEAEKLGKDKKLELKELEQKRSDFGFKMASSMSNPAPQLETNQNMAVATTTSDQQHPHQLFLVRLLFIFFAVFVVTGILCLALSQTLLAVVAFAISAVCVVWAFLANKNLKTTAKQNEEIERQHQQAEQAQKARQVEQAKQHQAKLQAEFAEMSKKSEMLQNSLNQLQYEIGHKQHERQSLLQQNNLNSLTDKFFETQNQSKTANYNFQVAQKTLEMLKLAKENLSTSYLPRLSKKCSQLMHNLSNGKFSQMTIDKDFNISITENHVTKPSKFFSRGIKELSAFCFRIALSTEIYKKIPLLMLDDVFVNLDEKNFNSAMNLVKTLSKDTQIIYFTCQRRKHEGHS